MGVETDTFEARKDADFWGQAFTKILYFLFRMWGTAPGRTLLGVLSVSFFGGVTTAVANYSHSSHAGKRVDSLEAHVMAYEKRDSLYFHRDSLYFDKVFLAIKSIKGTPALKNFPKALRIRPAGDIDSTFMNHTAKNQY